MAKIKGYGNANIGILYKDRVIGIYGTPYILSPDNLDVYGYPIIECNFFEEHLTSENQFSRKKYALICSVKEYVGFAVEVPYEQAIKKCTITSIDIVDEHICNLIEIKRKIENIKDI